MDLLGKWEECEGDEHVLQPYGIVHAFLIPGDGHPLGIKGAIIFKDQGLLKAIREVPEGYEETPELGIVSFDENGRYMEVVDLGEGEIHAQVLPSHAIPPLWYAKDSEVTDGGGGAQVTVMRQGECFG